MHCPKCGQQQISDETRFCSRCGLLLTGIAEAVANNGMVSAEKTGLLGAPDSPKRRGVKLGAFLFLLTFLIVPILIVISISLNLEPFLPLIGMFLFGVGGLLRVVYALMFEPGGAATSTFTPNVLPVGQENYGALPPSQTMPASAYTPAGGWRDTNDLQQQPGSVTDNTTKLLEKEQDR